MKQDFLLILYKRFLLAYFGVACSPLLTLTSHFYFLVDNSLLPYPEDASIIILPVYKFHLEKLDKLLSYLLVIIVSEGEILR